MDESVIVVPELDLKRNHDEILRFIKEVVDGADAKGVVVGLSGGVDSSLVATLCVKALGNVKVLGILMPTSFTPQRDIRDALELAKWLGIRTETVDVQRIYEAFYKALKRNQGEVKQIIPMANVLARIRMTVLYYYANIKQYLVAGTGDRSEDLIGYFTKYGDGAVDFLPISHLYKTQVRKLARHLGVPKTIAYKPSSPQLYPGHKATDEIPIEYERLDPVLVGLFDRELPPGEVSLSTGVPIDVVRGVLQLFFRSKHKRAYPPMLREWGAYDCQSS
jgi:NAD+ synthase